MRETLQGVTEGGNFLDPVYLAPFIFFFIALVFSMLGMGGSQLYIPILFWLGMDFKTEAIPLGMLLNVVNSSSAAISYGRERLIDWKVAPYFGVTMIVFAPVGALINADLPTTPLILVFACFTIVAALLMLSGWKPKKGEMSNRGRIALGLAGGSVLGFFAGLIGRGGGSFVVPLLYIAGLDPKAAAATSAFVVTCSGASSFVSHVLIAAQPNWLLWVLCALTVLAGSQLGSRLMAKRMKPRSIKSVFGGVLLGVSAILIVQTLA
ncbi:MAG: sulfite exporter TauE/SafE family protein [Promethearchaeota archaeon]